VPPLALPDPPLSDGVIALRRWTAADVPAIVEACQDPEITRWTLVPSPYGEKDARAYLERVADGWDAGVRGSFAVVDGAGGGHGTLLGATGLEAIDWDQRAADVGYWVAAPARGHGVATRAVELLAGWAFGPLGIERLELRTDAGNAASQAVAARAGFTRSAGPLVRRPECDHMPDIFFARVRNH
jgi:RimJ/RimL family protein N-acetyltransferase